MSSRSLLKRFFQLEASSGIVLLAFTLLTLTWVNSPLAESYESFWHTSVAGLSLHHWVSEGMMSVFFLIVGLEIKRELSSGELSSPMQAFLPAAAALGGMLLPALIYGYENHGKPESSGWGIPMATDIAFAIAVLAILGRRVPTSLKVFLTALAIIDDLGAVLVIALFYTHKIFWIELGEGIGVLTFLYLLNRMKIERAWIYLILGAVTWFLFLKSGVHATIAGVLLAWVMPISTGRRIEPVIHPWVSYVIMPIFALANAGVALGGASMGHPVSIGIIGGLVLGKPIGIVGFSWIAVKLKLARLPRNLSWKHIIGAGCLGGIGFTMSFFIANLGIADQTALTIAKIAILSGSALSATLGATILSRPKFSKKLVELS